MKIRVLGHGRSWPGGAPVTNQDLLRRLPENSAKSDEALQAFGERLAQKFGVYQRHLARLPSPPTEEPKTVDISTEETSESLALRAARSALQNHPNLSVGAFVHGTTTSSRYTGSQAPAILTQLGSFAPGFEIKAGCSTSLASVHLGLSLLSFGHSNVLISCAETLSKVMNPHHKETWFIAADGGAALWIEKNEEQPDFEILKSIYHTDGRFIDLYTTPGKLPPNQKSFDEGGYYLFGDGDELRKQALLKYLSLVEEILPDHKGRERIRWIIPHQINRDLIVEVCRATGLSGELFWSADRFGNVGGASVLFSLSEALESGKIQRGDEILLMSVGGGLSYAIQHWVKS